MNLLIGVSMDSGEFATEIINSDSERNGITLDYFRKEIAVSYTHLTLPTIYSV